MMAILIYAGIGWLIATACMAILLHKGEKTDFWGKPKWVRIYHVIFIWTLWPFLPFIFATAKLN